jgi:hypothetical protein
LFSGGGRFVKILLSGGGRFVKILLFLNKAKTGFTYFGGGWFVIELSKHCFRAAVGSSKNGFYWVEKWIKY